MTRAAIRATCAPVVRKGNSGIVNAHGVDSKLGLGRRAPKAARNPKGQVRMLEESRDEWGWNYFLAPAWTCTKLANSLRSATLSFSANAGM